MTEPVLNVRDLTTRFHTRSGTVHAVNGISYTLHAGQSLALVGESGSGKSVSALSLLGLVPPPGKVEGGQVILNGRSLLDLSPREWQDVLGREVAMVFQDPMTSLNPVLTVGRQLAEPLRRHMGMNAAAAAAESAALLQRVGIPNGVERLSDYPHQFSGGQRQRIMIAMALACRPAVLIADEPTTALDVTIQAQIVALVKELQAEMGMAILWITHDLALVAGLVDRVAVMYGGTIVEQADVAELYANPRHPYTRGLLASLPEVASATGRLVAIEGRPPDLRAAPTACPFAPRCAWAVDRCRQEIPPLQIVTETHASACWRWSELDVAPVGAGAQA
ncbi:MAG: ABC transporter ATP-binding protein [Alphaproteobacteria bacterium]